MACTWWENKCACQIGHNDCLLSLVGHNFAVPTSDSKHTQHIRDTWHMRDTHHELTLGLLYYTCGVQMQ